MSYQQYDLGHIQQGALVEISLRGSAANVLLLDPHNLGKFRSGREYRYYGGHATSSPVHITVPTTGNWHVVVNLGGHRGTVQSAVRVQQ